MNIIVIGGGAAGFFAAVNAAESNPKAKVSILEKSTKILSKVKVSGGGRCNVTHACFKQVELSKFYPRGERFLKKAFGKFYTKDTVEWFESRGVQLKTEEDGRMFPVTDNSQTIIDCLVGEAQKYGVQIQKGCEVIALQKEEEEWCLSLKNGEVLNADKVIITTGGSPKITGLDWIVRLGHQVESPVPSLFTFNIPNNSVTQLMGLSVPNARVKVVGTKLESTGALLVTHWGLSGPAVLKLSAWGARALHDLNYNFKVLVSWLGEQKEDAFRQELVNHKNSLGTRKIVNKNPFTLPKRLWEYILLKAQIGEDKRWCDLSKKELNKLLFHLISDEYEVKGKTTFKEEFVTCGGVKLSEVNVKTLESKVLSGLYFAGEVLDIDGVTGGFNFQAAWTTGFLAGQSAAQ